MDRFYVLAAAWAARLPCWYDPPIAQRLRDMRPADIVRAVHIGQCAGNP